MKSSTKILIVIGGYVAALAIAVAVVALYIAFTDGPDRQNSAGMYAFGDSIAFLGVFGLGSVPATAAALFFLRPFHRFWQVLSICALGIAATGIAALIGATAIRTADTTTFFGTMANLSPLRILAAPLLGLAFFLCALFAPTRFPRIAFAGATAIETVVFVAVMLVWTEVL